MKTFLKVFLIYLPGIASAFALGLLLALAVKLVLGSAVTCP